MRVHKDTPHPLQASQQLAAAGSVSSLLGLYSRSLFPSSLPYSPGYTMSPHSLPGSPAPDM